MSYITELGLPVSPVALQPADVAKMLWSTSVRSIPFTYKNAKELKVTGNHVTMVKVGMTTIEVADRDYDGPVAIVFAPRKALAVFSMYYHDGTLLNELPSSVARHITNAHGDDMFLSPVQLDKYFYRVDYVADRNGAVPYNIEINPKEVDNSVMTELIKSVRSKA